MMKTLKIGMVSALAVATALPAFAQQYRPTDEYGESQREYDAQRERYEAQRSQYEANRASYRESRRDYAAARAEYDARLAAWERARAAYDARHGYGAYARISARPVWDDAAWAYNSTEARRDARAARRDYQRRLAEWERARGIYDRRYGYGAYARLYPRPTWDQAYWTSNTPPPYAGYYGSNASAAVVPCSSSSSNNNTVAGGLIGALAGAVLGSQVASRGARTEGAVLGGVAGAVIGGSIGNAKDRDYKCDSRGPYFSYDDTVPYREGRNRYSSAYDYNYYSRQRCRLAAAPVDAYGRDVRYVRVCPDEQGRYRITG